MSAVSTIATAVAVSFSAAAIVGMYIIMSATSRDVGMIAVIVSAAINACVVIGTCIMPTAMARGVGSIAIIASASIAAAINICVSDRLAVPPHRKFVSGAVWMDAVVWGLATIAFAAADVAGRPRPPPGRNGRPAAPGRPRP